MGERGQGRLVIEHMYNHQLYEQKPDIFLAYLDCNFKISGTVVDHSSSPSPSYANSLSRDPAPHQV